MEPRARVEMTRANEAGAADRWLTLWSVTNLGESPLEIFTARLPHGKFRSDEKVLTPSVAIDPQGAGGIQIEARCAEPPGAEIENGFLILRVHYDGDPWLILARLRIRIDAHRTPSAATELITVQRVGFSETRASEKRS
jgi:hypothetical protein